MGIAKANKLDQHQVWSIPAGSVVLVGDSILESADQQLFTGTETINRGIRGDTINGVIERVAPILDSDVSRVVLMIGINDIQRGGLIGELNERIGNLSQVLCSSGKNVDWLSVLPINPQIYRREIVQRSPSVTEPTLEIVEALNSAIKQASSACGTVAFVDLVADFADHNGELDDRWTIDGLHLSGRGLQRLADRF